MEQEVRDVHVGDSSRVAAAFEHTQLSPAFLNPLVRNLGNRVSLKCLSLGE